MKRVLCGSLIALIVLAATSCSLESIARGGVEPSVNYSSCVPAGYSGHERKVTVVSLGWHTGILVESADIGPPLREDIEELSKYPFVEFGWGDTEFYMSSGYSVWKGLKAAVLSSGTSAHVAGFDEKDAKEYLDGLAIIELRLTAEGLDGLADFVAKHLQYGENGKPIAAGEALYGKGHFYLVEGDTSVFHTCNSWAADALKAARCDLKGSFRRSSTLLAALRKLNPGGGSTLP
jgi:hypothetical protein